ncbi:MAG: BON domain-containing protein [Acidobacteria bacterium]|nr:BON domain-containing protein [Acidobacteriota bacterium]
MRLPVTVAVFIVLFSAAAFGQELTREQKLLRIDELNSQIQALETDVLLPAPKDLRQAEKEGFEVFRLMPRERYDGKLLAIPGGGAYYSFTNRANVYRIPQLELGRNNMSVGFAGANYGFIADLGAISLADVTTETSEIGFLLNYRPPAKEREVRVEQRKSYEYETESGTYRDRAPVNVGHVYALRAISFEEADVLVAFKVVRKDTDGSLIIFWKMLKDFEKPRLIREEQSLNSGSAFVSARYDGSLAARVEAELKKRGFTDVRVFEEKKLLVLSGTVPKGKLAEVLRLVQKLNGGKPVYNELTEK